MNFLSFGKTIETKGNLILILAILFNFAIGGYVLFYYVFYPSVDTETSQKIIKVNDEAKNFSASHIKVKEEFKLEEISSKEIFQK